ncbi:MAG: hypothetical protein ACK6A4_05480 [Alphaproteobacteria bacterium]
MTDVEQWNWAEVAAFAVPLAGILLPVAVAYAANNIAARNGRIPLLEFAHMRMVSANKAAGYLADDLERVTFALEDMSRAVDGLEWEALEALFVAPDGNKDGEGSEDPNIVATIVEQKIRQALSAELDDDNLSNDQKALRYAFNTLSSVLGGLQGLLRNFADDPFVTAVTNSHQTEAKALSTKVNKLLGHQFYKLGALSVAGLMSGAASDAAERLIKVVYRFSGPLFTDADKVGLFIEHDLYELGDAKPETSKQNYRLGDQASPKSQYVLVNSGLLHLNTMYSLLPAKKKIADVFAKLVHKNGDEIARRYAELTGVDFEQLIDEQHVLRWEGYRKSPASLIFVGSVSKPEPHRWSDVVWERYNPTNHGALSNLLKLS